MLLSPAGFEHLAASPALRYLRPIAALLVLVGLVLLLERLEITQYMGITEMKSLMESVSPYEPLVFIGLCIAAIFLHLPVIFVIALGGALFGVTRGFFYGWVGSVLGASGTFLLVRYAAREAFQKKVSVRFPWLRNIDERLGQHGLQTILFLRFFLFMAPPLNWIIGVSQLQFRHYLIGTLLAPIPLMILTNYFGSKIAEAQSLWVLTEPEIFVPGVLVLGGVLGGGLIGSRFLSKPHKLPAQQ